MKAREVTPLATSDFFLPNTSIFDKTNDKEHTELVTIIISEFTFSYHHLLSTDPTCEHRFSGTVFLHERYPDQTHILQSVHTILGNKTK